MKAIPSLLLALGTVAAAAGPAADDYSVIAEKNVFRLNDPPPPPSAQPAKEETTIQFAGSMAIGSDKKGFFVVQGTPVQYVTLGEGEKQGALELIKLGDDKATIRNAGRELVLTLKDNSPPASGVPHSAAPVAINPAALNPNIPPTAGGIQIPPPSGTNGAGTSGVTVSGALPISGTPSSVPVPGGPPVPNQPAAQANGLRSIPFRSSPPTRTLRLAPVSGAVVTEEKKVDPVVQRIQMEADQIKAKDRKVEIPPLPPIPE